jgi:hypothetical protein
MSLLELKPSTWCAAVAVPHKNPCGKWNVALGMMIILHDANMD